MLIRISNTLIVFLFELVFISVGIGITAAPEFLNEPLTFVIGGQFLESLSLFVGNDISDVLLKPILVSLLEFRLHIARLVHRILAFRFVFREPKQTGSSQDQRENGQAKRGILVRHN